jgi:predicted nucleic acid-binding protein
MPFVIDASITAAWLLPDEKNSLAEQCLDAFESDHALVPGIWRYETRNLMLIAERRQRLSPQETQAALEVVARYPIHQDTVPEEAAIVRLARKHALTFYDAAYLELALRRGVPLATLDARLGRAARAETIPEME